jgi:hypothetical protein
MNSITTEKDTTECIRCLEKGSRLVLRNFKEFPQLKSLTSRDKLYLFHKIHYFPVCIPCIVQLCNRNIINDNELSETFNTNLGKIVNNKNRLYKEVKEFKKLLSEEILELKEK